MKIDRKRVRFVGLAAVGICAASVCHSSHLTIPPSEFVDQGVVFLYDARFSGEFAHAKPQLFVDCCDGNYLRYEKVYQDGVSPDDSEGLRVVDLVELGPHHEGQPAAVTCYYASRGVGPENVDFLVVLKDVTQEVSAEEVHEFNTEMMKLIHRRYLPNTPTCAEVADAESEAPR